MRDLNEVASGYYEALIWADTPEEAEGAQPHDSVWHDCIDDCEGFLALLDKENVDTSEWSDRDLGIDFWLTRQHHGSGFWDRGREAGKELTKWAQTYGERYLYVDDDNKLRLG